MTKTVRISMNGRVSDHAATTLGGWVDETDLGPVLVAPYVDQAQLTGLLVQLSDLHLGFHHVEIDPAAGTTPTVTTNTTTTNNNDNHSNTTHARSHPMTTTTTTTTNPTGPTDTDLAVTRTKRLGLAAVATTTIAVVAGLCMLALDPAAGSTLEAVFGFVAAVSGLMTAALVVVAVVYAHAKGLWTRLPINWRYVVWALLALGIARSIWSQVSNLS